MGRGHPVQDHLAQHEGGHAKDFAQRTYKGTYSFLYMLPFFALYPEYRASADAISYLRVDQTVEEEKAAYKVLWPAYTTYIGGNMTQYIMPNSWVYFAAVIPGHIAGRIKASRVEADRAGQPQQARGE